MSIHSPIQTQPLAPTDPEAQIARQSRQALASLMQSKNGEIRFRTGADNDASPEVVLSSSAVLLLLGALEEIGKGNGVTLVPTDAELTTQQAAEMARVSRPFFVKMLEEGKIPFRMVGAHRRVLYRDVARYIEEEEARRIAVMEELVAETERLGLYE